MSDNPKKNDPAEKKLDTKDKPAGWTAEQAREQLVKDSLENRPSKNYEKPPEPPSTSILGSVADWIVNTFSSSSSNDKATAPGKDGAKPATVKQETEKQTEAASYSPPMQKPEASKQDSYKPDAPKTEESRASKSEYRGWIGEEPQSASKSPTTVSGWVGEEPQSAGKARSTASSWVGEEPRSANKAESTVKGWIGEEPQSMMARQATPQNGAWPDETKHGRGAEAAASNGSKSVNSESGAAKPDDKSCTEADSPKADLNQFPEFFRKYYEKPEQQQQIDPREEQRQEQREMRRAAESGSGQAAPQAETPHPSSVEMWTKQAPTPGSWDAIKSIYGNPSKSKFDGVLHHEVGAGRGELSQEGKNPGHSSGGSALEQAGDSHGNPSISGKDLSAGGLGSLGAAGKPANGGNDGNIGRGEIGAFGKDGGVGVKAENSFVPGKGEISAGAGDGKNEHGGKYHTSGLNRNDDTASGGTLSRTQNSDTAQLNASKSSVVESRLERGDQRPGNSDTLRTASDASTSRTADTFAPKTSDQLQRITADDQNQNRAPSKNDNPSKEFDLQPAIRYVPENKDSNGGPVKQVSEPQNLPQSLARISSENKNGEQILLGGAKRIDGFITEKSPAFGLPELKTTPILRDFRSGDILPQDFKAATDATKFIGTLDARLAANAVKSLEPPMVARGLETGTNGALRANELGLPGNLASREGKLDQNIFSTKLGEVQSSARTIDMLLGSKTEIANSKAGSAEPGVRDLAGRDRHDALIAGRGIKANVTGLREDLIIGKVGNEANLSGRTDRGFEIVSGGERIRAERGLRGERDDLAELRALLDRTSKFSGEKRYLTGVEIALAAAIAAVAVAKTRSEKEIAISQAELAAKQLQELMEDIDLTTPESDEAEDRVRLPWQADNASGDKKRPEYMVAHNDTLISIAEQFYNDSAVAWLIADINKDRIAEFNEDGKRIIEMRSRQSIELPLWGEVNDFLRNRSELVKTTEIVTIVSQTEVDRELLDSFLSTVIGASSKGEGSLGESLGNLSLSNSDTNAASTGAGPTIPPQPIGALARSNSLPEQQGSGGAGVPAYAGATGAATMALAMEGNQLTVLLSLGKKLLPSFSSLKKAGMNLQSYVSGRDWQHGGLNRSEDELK